MKAPYTMFGQTRLVEVKTYTNSKIDKPAKEQWDVSFWAERGEDFYALLSPDYRNKVVRVVEPNDWRQGTPL